MIIMIGGASHTGKTLLAQRLLEKYHYPYLSIDHLKMGLIRSKMTDLSPEDSDEALTALLWPMVREIIKTAIENRQNLIVEGCYIPFDFKKDFSDDFLTQIRHVCIIFSERYIKSNYQDIIRRGNAIERRLYDDYPQDNMISENLLNLRECKACGCEYILIDKEYNVDFEI